MADEFVVEAREEGTICCDELGLAPGLMQALRVMPHQPLLVKGDNQIGARFVTVCRAVPSQSVSFGVVLAPKWLLDILPHHKPQLRITTRFQLQGSMPPPPKKKQRKQPRGGNTYLLRWYRATIDRSRVRDNAAA